MKWFISFVVLTLLSFSPLAVAQLGGQSGMHGMDQEAAPVEEWPSAVIARMASAPDSYSGKLSMSELVSQLLSDFSAPDSTVNIRFDIPVIQDDQVLIESPVMSTLPMEQAQRDIDRLGFTEREKRSSRTDAFVSLSFESEAHSGDSDSENVPFALHVQQALERYFVAGFSQAYHEIGDAHHLQFNPSYANCGGAAVGTTFTVSVTSCLGTTLNPYECMQFSVDEEIIDEWIVTNSYFYPREVEEICW